MQAFLNLATFSSAELENDEKLKNLLETLSKNTGWAGDFVYLYQGFWLPAPVLRGLLLVQNHFKPRPTDIILSAFMKSGTTWLRALMFATLNRSLYTFSDHPLLHNNPHDCFPAFEFHISKDYPIANDLDLLPSDPRLFATHLAHSLLPESMTGSSSVGCKYVYICRDPKDVIISKWHFMRNLRPKELPPLSLHEAFELFCEGVSEHAPFWDHVLGYWRASLESPDKILFLKYEDVKKEPSIHVKRLAEFMGKPFSPEEEQSGVVEEIVDFCSFKNLSSLEVNKNGFMELSNHIMFENRNFFRKGEIGDWENHLTSEMKERLDRITQEKLAGSGLTLGATS